jgi:hypothetical protein
MSSPADVLPYDASKIEVLVPWYDYISPELIQLYITNNGSHQPSYILLSKLLGIVVSSCWEAANRSLEERTTIYELRLIIMISYIL